MFPACHPSKFREAVGGLLNRTRENQGQEDSADLHGRANVVDPEWITHNLSLRIWLGLVIGTVGRPPSRGPDLPTPADVPCVIPRAAVQLHEGKKTITYMISLLMVEIFTINLESTLVNVLRIKSSEFPRCTSPHQ